MVIYRHSLELDDVLLINLDFKRVHTLWGIMEKIAKNVKFKSQEPKNAQSFSVMYQKRCFSGPVTLFLYFFILFSEMRQSISTLPVILSFMNFCVARTFLVELHLDDVFEVLLAGLKLVV